MGSVLVWADVPVTDLERAKKFYAHVLQLPVESTPGMDGVALVMGDPPSVDLALNSSIKSTTTGGTTIYFGANGDIDGMLARAEAAGGRILGPKQFYGEMIGWLAYIEDTEGNRIGIQQPPDQPPA